MKYSEPVVRVLGHASDLVLFTSTYKNSGASDGQGCVQDGICPAAEIDD